MAKLNDYIMFEKEFKRIEKYKNKKVSFMCLNPIYYRESIHRLISYEIEDDRCCILFNIHPDDMRKIGKIIYRKD